MSLRREIGKWRGISFEAAAWDGARAEVELSCVCMFTHEVTPGGPVGGLLHLDTALSGALTGLRRDGYFAATAMETLLISRPPVGVAADAVLLVGLGDPAFWTVGASAQAAATAMRTALQLNAKSAAFAPSVLDGGLTMDVTGGMPAAMMNAVLAVLDTQHRLVELGMAPQPALERWGFDVGAERFENGALSFETALSAAQAARGRGSDLSR